MGKIILMYGLLYGGVCVILLLALAVWVVFGRVMFSSWFDKPVDVPQCIQQQADEQARELAKQGEPGSTVTVFVASVVKAKMAWRPLPVCACLLGIVLLVYGIGGFVVLGETANWEVVPPDEAPIRKP